MRCSLPRRSSLLGAWLAATLLATTASSATPRSPDSTGQDAIVSLLIEGDRAGFSLDGKDSGCQLIVNGRDRRGRQVDVTRQVVYEAAPAGIVAIDAAGWVSPGPEPGWVQLRAHLPGGGVVSEPLAIEHRARPRPISFANEVVPILTKFGCNAGGCHGKATGQNGFKLSLLGFEPDEDYEALVREARGRRLFPAAPERSLLLAKATGAAPHGGGARIDAASPFARVLCNWIAQGAPPGGNGAPVVERIEVIPDRRMVERGADQQLAVMAHLSDGSRRDVTRMTQFEPNDPELADVTGTGLVTVHQLPGSVAVMARYQSHVAVFEALVPLGAPVIALPAPRNFIDKLIFARLEQLGLPPSDPCDDATFLRRATLDIAGRLPTQAEVKEFLACPDAAKDAALVDRLLASPQHADFFAQKWGAILRNRRRSKTDDPRPTAAFHDWIRNSLNENKPYNDFVSEILTATGEEVKNPPVLWYREVQEPSAQVEDFAQLFLGQRIGCAHCHHHPLEKWSQQDYYGLAAFFARVTVKDPPPPKPRGKTQGGKAAAAPAPKPPFEVEHTPGVAEMAHPRTGVPVRPTVLGGAARPVDEGADPRRVLAGWLAEPENPFFARALVNRYWKHFLGRGLVEPEDDLRQTNPATSNELLDALARHFVERGYDLKDLIRTICTAQVYRLDSRPNAYNADDRRNFSRYLPRRLSAEALLDAIDTVTLSETRFVDLAAGTRAVQLPDNLFDSYFLGVFGRPDSASACECERSSEATLAQCLHMFNSAEVLAKISGPRSAQLAGDPRPHSRRLHDLYMVALGRPPRDAELAALLAHLDARSGNVREAYEDILWVLINGKEFLFNH